MYKKLLLDCNNWVSIDKYAWSINRCVYSVPDIRNSSQVGHHITLHSRAYLPRPHLTSRPSNRHPNLHSPHRINLRIQIPNNLIFPYNLFLQFLHWWFQCQFLKPQFGTLLFYSIYIIISVLSGKLFNIGLTHWLSLTCLCLRDCLRLGLGWSICWG